MCSHQTRCESRMSRDGMVTMMIDWSFDDLRGLVNDYNFLTMMLCLLRWLYLFFFGAR